MNQTMGLGSMMVQVPLTTSDVLDGEANMITAEKITDHTEMVQNLEASEYACLWRQTGISQLTDMPDRCV